MHEYPHILELEHRVLTAIFSADKATMRTLMTPDGLGVDAGFGFASQASLIDGIHQLSCVEWSIVAPQIRAVGASSFVITYVLAQRGAFGGEPIPPTVYASTVWTLRDGAWWAVFHQETAAQAAA